MPGDGNCFFTSVSYGLWYNRFKSIPTDEQAVRIVSPMMRQWLVAFLRTVAPGDIDPRILPFTDMQGRIFNGNFNTRKRKYLDVMENDGTWAGKEEMIAFMDLFKCRLIVIPPSAEHTSHRTKSKNEQKRKRMQFENSHSPTDVIAWLDEQGNMKRIPHTCSVLLIMRNHNHFNVGLPPRVPIDTRFGTHLERLIDEVGSHLMSRINRRGSRSPSRNATPPRVLTPPQTSNGGIKKGIMQACSWAISKCRKGNAAKNSKDCRRGFEGVCANKLDWSQFNSRDKNRIQNYLPPGEYHKVPVSILYEVLPPNLQTKIRKQFPS